MRFTGTFLAATLAFGVALCQQPPEASAADRLKVEFTKKPTGAKSGPRPRPRTRSRQRLSIPAYGSRDAWNISQLNLFSVAP